VDDFGGLAVHKLAGRSRDLERSAIDDILDKPIT